MPLLEDEIRERGRIHTPWSGAVRMLDGVDYHGNVWKLPGSPALYVFYQNRVYRVYWVAREQRYAVGP